MYRDIDSWIEAVLDQSEMNDNNRDSRKVGSWGGTNTFDKAIDLARKGWKKGAALAKELSEFMTANLTTTTHHKVRTFSRQPYGGGSLLIPVVLSGMPNPYVHSRHETNTKFIRLVVNGLASGGIDTQVMIQKGVVASALVELLELNGYRVQVDLVFPVQGSGSIMKLEIVLKSFQESLDLDRITFFTANPASLRRLCFSWMECQDKRFRAIYDVGGSYGSPADAIDKGDIYLPKMSWGEHQFSTKERALEYCLGILSQHGIKREGE